MAGYIRSFTIAEWVSVEKSQEKSIIIPLFLLFWGLGLLHIIWDFSATLFRKSYPTFISNLLRRQQTTKPLKRNPFFLEI